MQIAIPGYVKTIINILSSHGYHACIVGGCVRDTVLGVQPNDWDISTSALPEEVLELFPDALTTGMKHGTVTVRVDTEFAEVTTFRSDGDYLDHRHPETVSFIGDLTEDLSRRDFTINAMAIDSDGIIVDPFHGREDLEKKLIRAVGNPKKRFEEDALRMLRAFRFSSRLGFEIEGNTFEAIKENAHLATALASERVRDEVEKILLTSSPEQLYTLIATGLLNKYLKSHLESDERLKCIKKMPQKAACRWTAFTVVLSENGCIDSPREFLNKLRLDGKTIKCCSNAAEILKGCMPFDTKEWKKMLKKYGIDTVECAAAVWDAFSGTNCSDALEEILKSGECFSIKQLAVDGNDMASSGLKGKEIGEKLSFLVDYVIEYPENNTREKLMLICLNSEP